MNFLLSERSLDQRTVLLSVWGDSSAAAAGRLRQRLAALADQRPPLLIVDLSRVSHVDSAAVQALVEVAGGAKQSGTRVLVVEPIDPKIALPLELGRLDLVAEVVGTLGEAARRSNLPPEAIQPLHPAPPLPREPARPRRTVFGRRAQDQQILREMAELRRAVHELQRTAAPVDPPAAVVVEAAALPAELEAARREAARMEEEAEQAHIRAQALEGDVESVRAELAAARAELDAARGQADRMEDEAEQAHARVQALEGEVEIARQDAATLRTDLHAARSEIEMLREDIGAQTESMTSATQAARVTAVTEELERARAEADRIEEEAEQAHARIQALESAAADAAVAEPDAPAEAAADRDRVRAEEEARRRDAERARLAAERETEQRERAAEEERKRAEAQAERERAAEEERTRAEGAASPRPKVPVWADPTPINLNTAGLEDLMLLPGMGRRPAERILAARDARSGFTTVDDLYAIEDVPKDLITKIRAYVRV